MFDNDSDQLMGGVWPFLKRVLILFLPIWVYLICWSANMNIFLSAILAGLSIPLIQIFEKFSLRRMYQSESSEDNVIK